MSKSFTLNQLTEGIRDRHVGQESTRIQEKWTRTGLLRGLQSHNREIMSRLLENQAAQVLREANTLGSGNGGSNVDGFSNIAFPIVRRVFGGLVANELVSIQPMSLPSGLLFYLDYTYGADVGNIASGAGNAVAQASAAGTATAYQEGESLYGNPTGATVRTGASATGGMYDLAGSGYSRPHKEINLDDSDESEDDVSIGSFSSAGVWEVGKPIDSTRVEFSKNQALLQHDPQLIKEIKEGNQKVLALFLDAILGSSLAPSIGLDYSLLKSWALMHDAGDDKVLDAGTQTAGTTNSITQFSTTNAGVQYQSGNLLYNLKRLNQRVTWIAGSNDYINAPSDGDDILMIIGYVGSADYTGTDLSTDIALMTLTAPMTDVASTTTATGGTLVVPSFESNFVGGSEAPIIPEIDIKIESIAVTAQTRKLRARWSPELAQDLNAYHSMDAEVELTQILSEQIALEIDREILNDLLVEAAGANFFWSRSPGKFVNKRSGAAQALASTLQIGPAFTGTVREWYETLVETIIDVANEIHRKTLRGSANFIVVSPEVATIFEASILYKPNLKIDGQGQVQLSNIGAEQIGSLSNRFTVYKDPYFPRNKILVGYKGGSYLESGYVYAPYVPLIVTPTIFAPEDFTPRKGVMTRYGKKMVRADFYGTVTCLDMDVI